MVEFHAILTFLFVECFFYIKLYFLFKNNAVCKHLHCTVAVTSLSTARCPSVPYQNKYLPFLLSTFFPGKYKYFFN